MQYRYPVLFLVSLAILLNGIEISNVWGQIESPLYAIEEESQPLGDDTVLVRKVYSKSNQRILVESVKVKAEKEMTRSLRFGPATVFTTNEDSPLLRRGTHVIMGSGISVFGWLGKDSKSMFETFFSPSIKNLLSSHSNGALKLLEQEEIKHLESQGPIVALEKILGLPLTHKKGMTTSVKPLVRGNQLRCLEQCLVVNGADGKLQKEKRYVFYGNFDGIHGELFKWSLNDTTKLSWIDSEAGIGTFAFHDKDSDGLFETLECDVKDGVQIVEVFDVSNPWEIKLADEQQVIDRNVRALKDEKAVERLKNVFESRKKGS